MTEALKRLLLPGVATATLLATGTAFATNGYFAHGYGTAAKSMAGAGSAMSNDAFAVAANPASMNGVGTRLDVGIEAFVPKRDYRAAGFAAVPPPAFPLVDGQFESDSTLFFIPSFGYNRELSSNNTVGISVYGNGGMNTDYSNSVFYAGQTGVDMAQLFVALSYTQEMGNGMTLGVAPTLAAQRFKASGLVPFSQSSSDAANLTNRGYDYSYGAGVKVGVTFAPSDGITVGAAYHSRTYMSEFDKYKGLFAEQGDFDIPASANIGIAVNVTKELTIAADYQHIWYGSINAVANPGSNILTGAQLGASNGPGFGWDNMDVYKLGAAYRVDDTLTLRAGVSHNTQTYPSSEQMFNILAPGLVRTHLSFGGTYTLSNSGAVNFAYTRALSNHQTGQNMMFPPQSIAHQMNQHMVEVGYTYTF